MNRTLPLILTAALLLTACASAAPAQPADATTSPSAAASSLSQPAAETSAPPLTPQIPRRPSSHPPPEPKQRPRLEHRRRAL